MEHHNKSVLITIIIMTATVTFVVVVVVDILVINITWQYKTSGTVVVEWRAMINQRAD